ncbi:hypothetical protein AB5I41_00645 [Sphingomonas sp. MMS24-JH45]
MTTTAAPHRFGARDLAVVVAMNVLWHDIIAVKSAVELVPPLAAGFGA